jgi:hypothetical protein
MRTLLKISASALVVCAGLLIASFHDVSTSETIALGSPPTARNQRDDGSASGNLRGIQTTRLATGQGIVRTLKPGYLIVTSGAPDAPVTAIHISRNDSPVADAVPWEALAALTIVPSNEQARNSHLPDPREAGNTVKADKHDESETTRTFYLHVTDGSLSDPRQYVPVHSRPVAEGKCVRVYLDRQRHVTRRIERSARQIVETLEEQIIPRASREIGPWDDVDGDGRLSVLMTPWLEKLQAGKTSLKGFVRGSDFQPRYPAPFGNQADLIYVNSEIAGEVNYLTLLAHEYWHVLQCSYRLSMPESPLSVEEDWINEGTAHLAEIRFGGDAENLTHRIDTWLSSPEAAPLVVENYYSAGLWRDDGCRGATFLFFHWCEQQFGSDLAQRLLTSPTSGARNLQQVTGNDLETLQTHWTVAMLDRCQPADRPAQSEIRGKLLSNTRAFEHVKLSRLRIHSTEDSDGGDVRFKLAPTATSFVRVEPGHWKIAADDAVSAPLRVTFVPEHATKRLADGVTAESGTELR